MRPAYIIAALAAAAVIIASVLWWRDAPAPEPPDKPATTDATTAAPPTPVEPVKPPPEVLPADIEAEQPPTDALPTPPAPPLPALAASDEYVRETVAAWSVPETWLQRSDLLARTATVLANTAAGSIPHRQVSFLAPADPYPVIQRGDQYFVDPAGYARYDSYLDLLESVPPAELAAFMRRVEPLLAEALAQLGMRQAPSQLVASSLERIRNVAALEAPQSIELLRPSVMYTYADPTLETLPALDKQLLRIGPENMSRLESYLIEFEKIYSAMP